MEELSSYYRELSLLQLKYEHLTETCRILLKIWPNSTAEEDSSCSQADHQVPETKKKFELQLNQLDTLLSKAQIVHTHKPEEPLTKKSMKLASSVYKTDDQKEKVVKKNSIVSGRGSQSSSRQTRSKKVPGYTGSKKGVSITFDKPRNAGGPNKKAVASSSHLAFQGAKVNEEAGEERQTEGFSIMKNGTQLSMPAKYYKLQRSISRCKEVLTEDITSKAAATHFSKRLLSKKSTNSLDCIRLQLAADEISLLREKLASIPPQDWTISERNTWQEILNVKTKVDMLIECYQAILQSNEEKTLLSKNDEVKMKSPLEICDLPPFAYSSVEDWNMLTFLEFQKRLKIWEAKYLRDVKYKLVPLVSQNIGNPHSENEKQDVSTLQALYLAGNISTNPVYLNTEN